MALEPEGNEPSNAIAIYYFPHPEYSLYFGKEKKDNPGYSHLHQGSLIPSMGNGHLSNNGKTSLTLWCLWVVSEGTLGLS